MAVNNDRMTIPAYMVPSYKTGVANRDGVENNILFRVSGGIGDQICAEPTLRYALDTLKGCRISLEAEHPELFEHLWFHSVVEKPDYSQFLVLDTMAQPTQFFSEYVSHLLTHCVDYPTICSLRSQLPIRYKAVQTSFRRFGDTAVDVVIHPGKHWPSKTFPKDWWDQVISQLVAAGITPVIIGANTDTNRVTVDVDTTGCVDLRNKTSILETIGLLRKTKVLLTNDSAPLHMAVSGEAWIGFISTAKHPDLVTHWRKDGWGWRMENHGLGGMWDLMDCCPNKMIGTTVEHVAEKTLRSWLPNPREYAAWAVSKI